MMHYSRMSKLWHLGCIKAVRMINQGYACMQVCEALGVSDRWLRDKLKSDLPSVYKQMLENGRKRMFKKASEIFPAANN